MEPTTNEKNHEALADFVEAFSLLPQDLLDQIWLETSGESLSQPTTPAKLLEVAWDFSIEAFIDEVSDPLIKLLCLVFQLGDPTKLDVHQTTLELEQVYNNRKNLLQTPPVLDESELSEWHDHLENYISLRTLPVFLEECSDSWILSICKDLSVSDPQEDLLEDELFMMGSTRLFESLSAETKLQLKESLQKRSCAKDPLNLEDKSIECWLVSKVFILESEGPYSHLPPSMTLEQVLSQQQAHLEQEQEEKQDQKTQEQTVEEPKAEEPKVEELKVEDPKIQEEKPEQQILVQSEVSVQISLPPLQMAELQMEQQSEDGEEDEQEQKGKKSKTPRKKSTATKKTPRGGKSAKSDITAEEKDESREQEVNCEVIHSHFEESNLNSLKVVDLRKICKELNISITGLNKAGLVGAILSEVQKRFKISSQSLTTSPDSVVQEVEASKSETQINSKQIHHIDSENVRPEENTPLSSSPQKRIRTRTTGSTSKGTTVVSRSSVRSQHVGERESLSPKRPLRTRSVRK